MDVSPYDALREAADPTTLMRRVSEQALTLIPGADGASLVIRIDDDTLECVAAVGTMSPHNGLRLRINQSLSGESALTGQLIRSDDVAQDPRVDPAATRRTGVASLLALPLSETSDRVVVLAVTSQRVNAFTPSDDHVLISLAEFVRRALDVAAELARVTTVLLASSHSQEERLQTARFVAEVVRPGLVDDIVGHRRVRDVLETTSMEMVVQPIADMRSGEVRMAEALARFTVAPSRGPDQWFAEAHRVGLGLQLELAAVQGALDLIASLPDSVALTVNVAPVVLASRWPARVGGPDIAPSPGPGDHGASHHRSAVPARSYRAGAGGGCADRHRRHRLGIRDPFGAVAHQARHHQTGSRSGPRHRSGPRAASDGSRARAVHPGGRARRSRGRRHRDGGRSERAGRPRCHAGPGVLPRTSRSGVAVATVDQLAGADRLRPHMITAVISGHGLPTPA